MISLTFSWNPNPSHFKSFIFENPNPVRQTSSSIFALMSSWFRGFLFEYNSAVIFRLCRSFAFCFKDHPDWSWISLRRSLINQFFKILVGAILLIETKIWGFHNLSVRSAMFSLNWKNRLRISRFLYARGRFSWIIWDFEGFNLGLKKLVICLEHRVKKDSAGSRCANLIGSIFH